jgi:hypothetical protein
MPWLVPFQLELFENDDAYNVDDKSEEVVQEKKQPTEETGYLTCKVCSAINNYELPRIDYICRGCSVFKEWIVKK